MSAERADDGLEAEPRHSWLARLMWGIWLLYLIQPVEELIVGPYSPLKTVVGITATAVFVGFYVRVVSNGLTRGPRHALSWHPLALIGLGLVMTMILGRHAVHYYAFVLVVVILGWPPRVSGWIYAGTIALAGGLPLLEGADRPDYEDAFTMAVVGLLMYGARRMAKQDAEIRSAHQEMARLAIVDERARFARDLHDILGHSLTAITVKAELARRIIDQVPERAKAEIGDVERLAREALEDVRRTAAGYRDVTLVGELAAARSVLTAAGVAADLPQACDIVPGRLRELFGWAVREGVTNAIRHSRASNLTVTLSANSVEIVDDGRGGDPPTGTGRGLTGLRERARAVGGTVEAGPRPEGGFRLRLAVPAADQTEKVRNFAAEPRTLTEGAT